MQQQRRKRDVTNKIRQGKEFFLENPILSPPEPPPDTTEARIFCTNSTQRKQKSPQRAQGQPRKEKRGGRLDAPCRRRRCARRRPKRRSRRNLPSPPPPLSTMACPATPPHKFPSLSLTFPLFPALATSLGVAL
jgi:hypothetical protein